LPRGCHKFCSAGDVRQNDRNFLVATTMNQFSKPGGSPALTRVRQLQHVNQAHEITGAGWQPALPGGRASSAGRNELR
jgi:hypothetical protein